jgi:hypothetical protein
MRPSSIQDAPRIRACLLIGATIPKSSHEDRLLQGKAHRYFFNAFSNASVLLSNNTYFYNEDNSTSVFKN